MTKKLPTAFYEQFIDEQRDSYSPANEFISKREKIFNFSQAILIRFGALTFSHPFLILRLLRQVQFGNAADNVDKAGFYKKPSVSRRDDLFLEAK